jgi:hypothetical protein
MAMWITRKLSFITQSSDQNIGFRRASAIIDRIHKPLPSIDVR